MVRALLKNGTYTSSVKRLFGTAPLLLVLRRKRQDGKSTRRRRIAEPRPVLPTYEIPCSIDGGSRLITYRQAEPDDVPKICKFVDFWLSGGAKRLKIPGAGKDFFVPRARQTAYLKYKTVYIACDGDTIIGWSVKSQNDTLIHLLVDARWRGRSIGTNLLKILDPQLIRSKSDQSTGDPLDFYLKHGYKIAESSAGKHKNIDVLKKE